MSYSAISRSVSLHGFLLLGIEVAEEITNHYTVPAYYSPAAVEMSVEGFRLFRLLVVLGRDVDETSCTCAACLVHLVIMGGVIREIVENSIQERRQAIRRNVSLSAVKCGG